MHAEAMQAIGRALDESNMRGAARVLDVGGRDVNGSPRPLFADPLVYDVLDIRDDPGVTIVADVRTWDPITWVPYDVVLCAETFEHLPGWDRALVVMASVLRPGGVMIVTAARDPRLPHSAFDGRELHDGEHSNRLPTCAALACEWYENVDAELLHDRMRAALGNGVKLWMHSRGDVYAWGRKPEG
jgi:hypothetical protein